MLEAHERHRTTLRAFTAWSAVAWTVACGGAIALRVVPPSHVAGLSLALTIALLAWLVLRRP